MAAPSSRPELLLTDVLLHAEGDGSTARAHRGVLATHSGVFRQALAADVASPMDTTTLPLPGKTETELRLLMGYLYPADSRSECFTLDNIMCTCERVNCCSRACQVQHWRAGHKHECAVARGADAEA
jgi:hypothetical protein